MKKDKILLNIENLEDVGKFSKLGYTNFLISLRDYSVGYTAYTFDNISTLGVSVYIFINMILTDNDIDSFEQIKIPKNVSGFVIEDIGLYAYLKRKGYEVILFQNHLNNNYTTVNYWLNYFDSLVLNFDLTKDEIETIVNAAIKPLILNAYGYPMIMYSRRSLIGNYGKNFDIDITDSLKVYEKVSNHSLIFVENDKGAVAFDNMIADYRKLFDDIPNDNVKFFIFNTKFLSFDEVVNALNNLHNEFETEGFYNKKTVYKIGDLK